MPDEQSKKDLQQWCNDVDAVLEELVARQPRETHTEAMRPWMRENVAPLHGKADDYEAMELYKKTRQERDDACRQRDEALLEIDKARQAYATLEARCVHAEAKLGEAQAQMTHLRACSGRDAVPPCLEKELDALSPLLRQLTEKYFDLSHVHVFLVQCGQFNRLTQFWEACRRTVLEQEAAPEDMSVFLQRILCFYNAATPQGEARLLQPESGTTYDFEVQQRVGQDGVRVHTLLLPGLQNPAGKILHKALVTLS